MNSFFSILMKFLVQSYQTLSLPMYLALLQKRDAVWSTEGANKEFKINLLKLIQIASHCVFFYQQCAVPGNSWTFKNISLLINV